MHTVQVLYFVCSRLLRAVILTWRDHTYRMFNLKVYR